MSDRIRAWIETAWPVLVALVVVVASFVALQGNVAKAQSTADRAEATAARALEATQGIREALIDLKRTVEERIPRPR